jgi:hypothetical protein
MSDDNVVLAKWNELKGLVEALEVDVAKNSRGVSAAGVRARKGLRELQAKSKELVKLTVQLDKADKTEKSASAPKNKKK